MPDTYNLIKKNIKSVVLVNITTVGSWVGFFVAVKYIEPAILSAIAKGVGPLVIIFISFWILKNYNVSKVKIISIFGIIISTAYLVYILLNTKNESSLLFTNFIGILMALLCGVSLSLNTIVTKGLNDNNFSVSNVMLVRFILLIILSGFLANIDVLVYTFKNSWLVILAIAVIGNLISLYFLQLGISKISPLSISYILVLAPIITLISQLFSGHIPFSIGSWVGVSLIVIFSIVRILSGIKK